MGEIPIKTEGEIKVMRENGRKLAEIIKRLGEEVAPGVKAKDLDRLAESLISNFGAEPSFKGYEGFPNALCVSVNEEIVHGISDEKILKEGDIVSLDVGLLKNGFHADMAKTFAVGEISGEKKRIMKVTKKTLDLQIEKMRPGGRVGDLGRVAQEYVEKEGYGVVRELCGHGVGRKLHEDPQIINFGEEGTGEEIKEGMVFCLEPMVTVGDWHIKKGGDGYAYVPKDDSLSCHFEHMVAVTHKGPLVLTKI